MIKAILETVIQCLGPVICNSLVVKTPLPYLQIGLIVIKPSGYVMVFIIQLVTMKSYKNVTSPDKLIPYS